MIIIYFLNYKMPNCVRLKRVSLSVYMYTRIVQILLLFYPLVNIPIPNLS